MKKNLALLTTIQSIFKFMSNSMSFYWAIYFAQIGLSGSQIGVLFSTTMITGLLITFPIGLINDRFSSKRILQLGLIILALHEIGLSITQSFPIIFVLFFIGGFGARFHNISIDSLFYKTAGDEKPTTRIKTYVGFFLLSAGFGALFSGNLLEYIDFQKYLMIMAGLTGLLVLISSKLPATDTFHFDLKIYKQDISKPHILLFMAIIFSFAIHMGSELTSYGPFLRDTLGLSFRQMGFYIGTSIMFMFLTVRVANRAIEKGASMRKIVTLGLLMSGIGYIIMLSHQIPISYIGRVIHESGDALMFVFLYAGVSNFFKKDRVGGNSGLITLTQTSAIAISSLIFAPLGAAFGHQLPIMIGAITTLLAIILLKFYERAYLANNKS